MYIKYITEKNVIHILAFIYIHNSVMNNEIINLDLFTHIYKICTMIRLSNKSIYIYMSGVYFAFQERKQGCMNAAIFETISIFMG